MKRLIREQFLPIDLDTAWNFFATPKNLNLITPPTMKFEILSDVPESMYPGLFIQYKISPFLGIKMDWCTEITQVRDREFFVDEQRMGPYRIWHHEHHFKQVEGGVLMTDILHYHVGMGPLGSIASMLFVDRMVESIFTFRNQKLKEIWV